MSATHWQNISVNDIPLLRLDVTPDPLGCVILLPEQAHDQWLREYLASLCQQHRLCALLPTVSAWWLNRPEPSLPGYPTSLAFLISALPEAVRAHWPALSDTLAIAGSGTGGQAALNAAYQAPQTFRITAAITPLIDFHRLYEASDDLQTLYVNQEAARQATATLNLHPLNWPPHQWFACPQDDWRHDACERLASKLRSSGIPFESQLDRTTEPDTANQLWSEALQFVAERLQRPLSSREIRFQR